MITRMSLHGQPILAFSRNQIHFISRHIARLKVSLRKTSWTVWMIECRTKTLLKPLMMLLKRRKDSLNRMRSNWMKMKVLIMRLLQSQSINLETLQRIQILAKENSERRPRSSKKLYREPSTGWAVTRHQTKSQIIWCQITMISGILVDMISRDHSGTRPNVAPATQWASFNQSRQG